MGDFDVHPGGAALLHQPVHALRGRIRRILAILQHPEHEEQQFSFASQTELNEHRPVGVSFKIGDRAPTTITTAFGNIDVTGIGDSGTSKGFRSSMRPT
jgi:hypothetical protein